MDAVFKKLFRRMHNSPSTPPKTIDKMLMFPPTPAASDLGISSPPSNTSSGQNSDFDVSRKGSMNGVEGEFDAIEGLFDIPLPPPSINPPKTLDVDLDTPDAHVPRDPRLIRLTGVHPFNVEAPLSDLFNSGFLTPPELFYVRNHGAVPKVEDEEILEWEVRIEGLVENPVTLTFREMSSQSHFPQYTLPITLVCAGNRRKEQNMVRKSQGFSWGPAGVSTCLFTGPMLSDVLAAAGPQIRKGAKYVWFEGADQLPHGPYGTSVKLSWVMDPSKGIMLAYKMNGEMLRPDHGRPIRVVIPGVIGGRSVKWLKKIVVADRPSENWYHYYDNRVLPTTITPENSKTEEGERYWRDERFAIYDLNVNSAIAYPAHDEILEVKEKEMQEKAYTVKGYAYGGGGRRITRVEISLDKGKSWRLAEITYPEDLYHNIPSNTTLFGGKLDMTWRDTCFCWCFWHISIPHSELVSPKHSDIVVRAMDESLHLQPKEMYWSVLGMMNNPWFRVVMHKDIDVDGAVRGIRFEHPTQPALMKGGWMERVKKEGGDLLDGSWGEKDPNSASSLDSSTEIKKQESSIVMTSPSVNRIIEYDELKAHACKEMGAWFVVEGEVYDGSPFLNEHPGGAQSIIAVGGTDCTEEFQAIHSENAKRMMPKYHIGTLSAAARKLLAEPPSLTITSTEPRETFLLPTQWLPTKLTSKSSISHDTILLTFALEHPTQLLGLPVGQHILIKLSRGGKFGIVIRAYTPIDHSPGQFILLVKVYRDEGVEGKRGGVMSQGLDALALGDTVTVKGPVGKFTYLPPPSISLPPTPPATPSSEALFTTLSSTPSSWNNVSFGPDGATRRVTKFLMVCAGTGITPIYQVLQATSAAREGVKCFVAYGNRGIGDMLCHEDLLKITRQTGKYGGVRIVHSLSRPEKPVEELGHMKDEVTEIRFGRVDVELLQQGVDWLNESESTNGGESGEGGMMVLVCGPSGLEEAVKDWMGEKAGKWEVDPKRDLCIF